MLKYVYWYVPWKFPESDPKGHTMHIANMFPSRLKTFADVLITPDQANRPVTEQINAIFTLDFRQMPQSGNDYLCQLAPDLAAEHEGDPWSLSSKIVARILQDECDYVITAVPSAEESYEIIVTTAPAVMARILYTLTVFLNDRFGMTTEHKID
jgi:hypothetical protein